MFIVSRNLIKEYLLSLLFIILPFIHILKLHLGNSKTYMIFTSLIFLLLIVSKKNKLNEFFTFKMAFFYLLIANSCIVTLYHILYYNQNYYFNIFFYTSNIFIFFIFYIIGIKDFVIKYLIYLLQYYLILTFFITTFDFYNILTVNIHNSLMYSINTGFNNLVRPLGLHGQATVNSIIFIFTYTFLLAIDYKYKFLSRRKKSLYSTLIILGTILQGSGMGIIILFLYFFISNFSFVKFFIVFIFLLLSLFFINFNISDSNNILLQRFTSEYFMEIFDIIFNEINLFLNSFHNFFDVLWGVYIKNEDGFGEFSILKVIYSMGFIYFILINIIFLIIYLKGNKYYKMSLFVILLGSLHYEAIYWSYIMIFLLPLFYYDILFISNSEVKKRVLI